MKSENGKTVVAVRGRGVRATPEQAREMCTCGHRASNHAALKYSCQAPGDHKGFCRCMRFLSAKEWRGSKAKASLRILRTKKGKATSRDRRVERNISARLTSTLWRIESSTPELLRPSRAPAPFSI